MDNSPLLIKYCQICNDKASGFNYNGLSCESCKVFFLRNASNNELTCSKYENCEINMFTRKSCAKCRLDKCFANGMIPKCISKRYKMEPQTRKLDIHMRSVLQNIDFACLETVTSDQLPNPLDLNLPQYPYLLKRNKNKHASELIAPERQVITNVQNVVGETFVDESRLKVIGLVSKLVDTFQHVALYTRKIVQFCKSIPAFSQLATNDQLIILKSFFYEVLVTRLAYVQDRINEGYPIIENEFATQAKFIRFDLALGYKNQELIKQSMSFQNELYDELENDFTIRDLLTAILLFKSRENLSNSEFVHYQYTLYCRLLRRYLEHKYRNVSKADRKYQTLIRLSDAFDQQKDISRFLARSEIDLEHIPPIVVEIMDL